MASESGKVTTKKTVGQETVDKTTAAKKVTKTVKKENTVYIVDGSRTPFLKARGRPGPFHAVDLAIAAARPLLLRQNFVATEFDQVILGCVAPGPNEANIARVAALRLGCGEKVPAFTVQRNCASGMQALDCAFHDIAAGRSDLILAGGVEAMSHSPLLFKEAMVHWLADFNTAKTMLEKAKVITQLRAHFFTPIIGLLRGLTDPVIGFSMGHTAEEIAHRFSISREQMDAYAVQSHQRLHAAQAAGYLDEIEVLYDSHGKFYEHDDGVRADSSIEKLAKLKSVFDKIFGSVTAGNSAQITDGAAWLILASETAVKKYDLPVMGKITDSEWAGLAPSQMGLGPAHAIAPLLKRNKFTIEDIDYWEINEAFAAQVIAVTEALKDKKYCQEELQLSAAVGQIASERLNIDGGGVSLGHPVGASGARIVLHLLHVLKRTQSKRGVAALCIGGGQGGAMMIERESV
ncbi:MAG: acetyl-CoA C-acetyltransferase [Gammaproteobacteria bacterium]|nr:acetyl-CoA C-acetyltransferase [Gammaproteobacteria bacterium]